MTIYYRKKTIAVAAAIAIALGCGFSSAYAVAHASAAPATAMSAPQGMPPQPPDGELPPGPPPDGMGPGGPGGPGAGGPQQQDVDVKKLSATKVIDGKSLTLKDQKLAAKASNASAVLVRGGGQLTLTDSTLTKTGDSSSADASNFSGQNAILLVADNSSATLDDLTLTSDADGANAVFATGEKTKVTARNLKIHTKNNSSRGLDATYGGTIEATNVDITTEGAHCGALATDRGEGNVLADGATIATSGEGSPCIYSTGRIELSNAKGEATGSEIAVVEGKNSITLNNVDLTGHVSQGVMLYQSFSGDAGVGEAKFTAKNSHLTNKSDGPMFFITNTTATASLDNVTLTQSGDTLVQVTSSRWGKTGSNGGNFTLNTQNQKLNGKILANNISTIKLDFASNTDFTGSINEDQQAKSVDLTLAKDATWDMTADSYLHTISDAADNFANIASNGHNIYYDKSANPSLNGKTYQLPGGGKLIAK